LPGQQPAGASAPQAPDAQPPAAADIAPKKTPPVAKIRAELHYDEHINRVVGRIVNEATGEEVRELPPEELRELYAKTREMLGPLVDEIA
jgi:hypothetical protein